ncbi:MAG: hypothetical protein OEY43_00570 [Gammaproteobacteria bacterium]|nr:hypothetical protein [Gammaproteobacteria bacterium]
MNSTIEATIKFSFKGENFDLCETLDLDAIMTSTGKLPDLHLQLARANNIDTYSYMYDAMESYPIVFRNPTGLACSFLDDTRFAIIEFEQAWNNQEIDQLIDGIAKKHLDKIPADIQLNIKLALLDAYNLGKSSRQT